MKACSAIVEHAFGISLINIKSYTESIGIALLQLV